MVLRGGKVRFSHLMPQLQQLALSETETAKLFQRMVIHETLIVLISWGDRAAPRLMKACQELKQRIQDLPPAGVILTAVVAEIQDVFELCAGTA